MMNGFDKTRDPPVLLVRCLQYNFFLENCSFAGNRRPSRLQEPYALFSGNPYLLLWTCLPFRRRVQIKLVLSCWSCFSIRLSATSPFMMEQYGVQRHPRYSACTKIWFRHFSSEYYSIWDGYKSPMLPTSGVCGGCGTMHRCGRTETH